MTEQEIKRIKAAGAYQNLCLSLDNIGYRYETTDDMGVKFGMNCEKSGINFLIFIDEDRQLIRFFGLLQFRANEDKLPIMAVALQHLNKMLAVGNFDLDFSDGTIYYRAANSFRGDTYLVRELVEGMLGIICSTVDQNTIHLAALNNGSIDFDRFVNNVSRDN